MREYIALRLQILVAIRDKIRDKKDAYKLLTRKQLRQLDRQEIALNHSIQGAI